MKGRELFHSSNIDWQWINYSKVLSNLNNNSRESLEVKTEKSVKQVDDYSYNGAELQEELQSALEKSLPSYYVILARTL